MNQKNISDLENSGSFFIFNKIKVTFLRIFIKYIRIYNFSFNCFFLVNAISTQLVPSGNVNPGKTLVYQ